MSDITIAGATFSDVTKIQIPKSGSGTAEFVEVSGSQEITQNNTYDVSALAQVVVNVSGGGGGGSWETESGTWTPAEDTSYYANGIGYSNSHDRIPDLLMIEDATGTELPAGSIAYTIFVNFESLVGSQFPHNATYKRPIGFASYYRSGSNTTQSGTASGVSSSSGSNFFYASYYTTKEKFFPYAGSTNFRSGRTYKWFALWKPQS